jgi:Tfp pilus assembly protein PilO
MKDKFNALAWYFQLLILVGIASLLYTGVWYFHSSDAHAEVQGLNEQVAALEAQNNAARIATQRINEFRALYATKEVEYDELKVLLPEQRELTNVLQELSTTAKESKLIVQKFSPQEDTPQDSMMAKPVLVEVDSNFNNLRVFFSSMAKRQRIVSITDFTLTQLPMQTAGRTLHAKFTLTAYYATPEDLTAPKPVPGKPGAAPGATTAPGAPATAPAVGGTTVAAPVPPKTAL